MPGSSIVHGDPAPKRMQPGDDALGLLHFLKRLAFGDFEHQLPELDR